VNLACKAVIGVITNLEYIDDTQKNYEDYDPDQHISRDVIATIRSLISSVYSQPYLDLTNC
jgi:hypothetical protein